MHAEHPRARGAAGGHRRAAAAATRASLLSAALWVCASTPAPAAPRRAPDARDDAPAVEAVGLRELVPQRPWDSPSAPRPTALVRDRTEPPGGERERLGDVAVVSRCPDSESCLDGLLDGRTGKYLLAPVPTRDEREVLAAPGTVQRVVRLVAVSRRYVSVYLGDSTLSSGAAHANNSLDCATYSRRTGRRLTLEDVVPPARARTLRRQARALVADAAERHPGVPTALAPRSFLLDATGTRVSLCTARWDSDTVLRITPPAAPAARRD